MTPIQQTVDVAFTVPSTLVAGQYFQYRVDWSTIQLPSTPTSLGGLGFVVESPTGGQLIDIPTEAVIGPAFANASTNKMNPPAMIDSGQAVTSGSGWLGVTGATTMTVGTTGFSCSIVGDAPRIDLPIG